MLHDWGSRDGAFYPGKLTVADSFRVGCIGRLGEAEMHGALGAMRLTLQEMGVTDCGPATPFSSQAASICSARLATASRSRLSTIGCGRRPQRKVFMSSVSGRWASPGVVFVFSWWHVGVLHGINAQRADRAPASHR